MYVSTPLGVMYVVGRIFDLITEKLQTYVCYDCQTGKEHYFSPADVKEFEPNPAKLQQPIQRIL